MQIISFAWTSAALLAGAKTKTRRQWAARHARLFQSGQKVIAYSRSPRTGGFPIAVIELTADPEFQNDSMAPDGDYHEEGFSWLLEHPEELPSHWTENDRMTLTWEAYERWRKSGNSAWVISFRLVETRKSLLYLRLAAKYPGEFPTLKEIEDVHEVQGSLLL